MTPLERRVEELEQRLSVLENGLGGIFDSVIKLGLSFTQTQILTLLLKRECASTEALWSLVWGCGADTPDSANALRVHIHNLRVRLNPHGIEIKNRHNFGYSIHPKHKEKIRELIVNATVLESAAVSEPAPAPIPAAGAGSILREREAWERATIPTPNPTPSAGTSKPV